MTDLLIQLILTFNYFIRGAIFDALLPASDVKKLYNKRGSMI